MAKKPDERYASAGDLALAAHDALTAPDQDQSDTILERSQTATLPGRVGPAVTPPPTPPAHLTPPPTYRQTPPPPYTPPPTTTPPPPLQSGPPPVAAFHTPYPTPGGPPGVGPPPWQQTPPPGPQPGSSPRKTIPWIPIGAIAGVVVLLLGALGIWLAVKPEPSSPPPAPTTTTTETTTTSPVNTYDRRLLNMLPPGYNSSVCKPADPLVADALSTIDCGKNSSPGGPASARYSLFPDADTLNQHFQASIKADAELVQCPASGIDSPTTWHYKATPDKSEGQIACGTYKGSPDLVWTKDSDLLLGDVQGAKLDELHNWWLQYG